MKDTLFRVIKTRVEVPSLSVCKHLPVKHEYKLQSQHLVVFGCYQTEVGSVGDLHFINLLNDAHTHTHTHVHYCLHTHVAFAYTNQCA